MTILLPKRSVLIQFGGLGQIDESIIAKRKYQRGHYVQD